MVTPFIAALLVAILGLVHLMLGTRKSPAVDVAIWARAAFVLGGVIVIAGAVLIFMESPAALWVYGAGWLLIQLMAMRNGITAFGRLRWSHHLVRFVIFGAVFVLAYLSQT